MVRAEPQALLVSPPDAAWRRRCAGRPVPALKSVTDTRADSTAFFGMAGRSGRHVSLIAQ
jgi:hypothetical protein